MAVFLHRESMEWTVFDDAGWAMRAIEQLRSGMTGPRPDGDARPLLRRALRGTGIGGQTGSKACRTSRRTDLPISRRDVLDRESGGQRPPTAGIRCAGDGYVSAWCVARIWPRRPTTDQPNLARILMWKEPGGMSRSTSVCRDPAFKLPKSRGRSLHETARVCGGVPRP
jgi:hypothetical protein